MKLLFQLLLLVVAVATAVSQIAKPGCPESCGNLSIPYPFGTVEGCYYNHFGTLESIYYNSSFLITCNATTNTSYLGESTTQVLSISPGGQLRVNYPVATDCYDKQGRRRYDMTYIFLGRFSLSSSLNKLIAVGCDTEATITGFTEMTGYIYHTAGCNSYCYHYDSILNGSCSGIGCCQLPVPAGAFGYNIGLSSLSNHSGVIDYNPCSYAFVVEDGLYNFSTVDLVELQTIQTFPVVVDWTVGDVSCDEAKGNLSAYACKSPNSMCIDSDKRSGYLCNCSAGFHGNPYLSNGCQDIDECADPLLNDCVSALNCQNTNGSYSCYCHKGYAGDGRKNGLRCIPQSKLSLVSVIIAGVASGVGFLLLLLVLWLVFNFVRRKRAKKTRQKFFKRNGGLLLEQQLSSTEKHVEKTKLFSSKELEIATDHYNLNRILGQGGQGTVYKGMLIDGRVVAIKKSKVVDEDKLDEFINEVVILSQINHRNVVKLFGCCLETEVPLLVYEFIPKGTLFKFLHDQSEQEFPITWEMRLQIATEVAGAVAYLHSSASMPIFHRDIKTSNILLDEKYRAKVADFGTSKTISVDQTHVTTRVQGTFGYLDPEYYQSSQFTEKSDVYSFGVVLVELLTGQKPISMLRSDKDRSLVAYFLHSMEENRLLDIVDSQVLKEGRKEEIIGIAELAKSCLKLNGKRRPDMKTVTMELERIRASGGVCLTNEQVVEEVIYEIEGYSSSWEITSSSTKSLHGSESQPLFSGNSL